MKIKKKTFWIIIVSILVILMIPIITIGRQSSQYNDAKSKSFTIAKKYGKLHNLSSFYIFNNEDKTSYAVLGENKNNEAEYCLIPKKSGKIKMVSAKNGITENDAKKIVWHALNPQKILNVSLGENKNKKIIWKVSYLNQKGNLCYEFLSFKNGDSVSSIKNIA